MAARPTCGQPSARGAHGVEDVRELEAVVAPETDEVVFGSVKNLLLVGIGEEGRK